MNLSEPKYLGFLAGVFVISHLLRTGLPRSLFLLAASYYFYFTLAHFSILLLLLVTGLTFFCGRALRAPQMEEHGPRRFALLIGIVLTPLLLFKYTPIAGHSSDLMQLLPIGISFFTFAAIGYLADVYLEVIEPESNLLSLALFLAFFPIVSAGPIERGTGLLPQLHRKVPFSADAAFAGLRLLFWGLVLKVILAGALEGPVNAFFAAPAACPALEKLAAMIFYSFYLYADFAGYSLIAIGSARLLGFNVRSNFNQPFLSPTVAEFWRNWHISLSSWVRDYIFSPLRMHWRTSGNAGMGAALLLSFIILGVWHGATWGYLAFGIMHGILVTASLFTLERRNAFWQSRGVALKWLSLPRTLSTFFLVLLTFVAFRANSVQDALSIYQSLFSIHLWRNLIHWIGQPFFDYKHPLEFQVIHGYGGWVVIFLLLAGDILVRKKWALERFPKGVQILTYQIGLIILLYQWTHNYVPKLFQYYKF